MSSRPPACVLHSCVVLCRSGRLASVANCAELAIGQITAISSIPASRQLVCACAGCMVSAGNRSDTPYRRVPRHVYALPDFQLSDAQWDELAIPVGMAFFFRSTPATRVLGVLSQSGRSNRIYARVLAHGARSCAPIRCSTAMQPDVEALLVNRLANAREYYLVPIDRCYELVGLMRIHWRGLAGGG